MRLLIETHEHRYDPDSEYLDHWTASAVDADRGAYAFHGGRYGSGEGKLESQAVRAAVNSYFKVKEVEG